MTVEPVTGNTWIALGLVILLLWGVILPIKAVKLPWQRRLILKGLRGCLFAIVVILLLRPSLVFLKPERFAGSVIFLVDASRSMQVADGPAGATRYETLSKLFHTNRRFIDDLTKQLTVRSYSFGQELQLLRTVDGQLQLPPEPLEPESALSWALQEIAFREAGQRLLAVVVLTDGAQRAAPPRDTPVQVAISQYQRLGIPIYAVPFGEPRGAGRFCDVVVDNLLVPSAAVVDNEVEVSVSVLVEGLPGRKLPVELWAEGPGQGELLSSTQLIASSVSHQETIRLSFTPKVAGELKLVVHIPPQPGETILQNNTRAAVLPVTRGGLRLLLVESFPPRPEFAFLRRVLTRGDLWELDVILLDARGIPHQLKELHRQLSTRDYQVFLLGNVPAWIVDQADWQLIVKKVLDGAGLIMIGGAWSFGPGGYADSPLADILPVRMSHLEIQRIDEPPRADVHLSGPLYLVPASAGLAELLFGQGESGGSSRDIWSKLPPLEGSNKFEGVKPAAQVLVQTPAGQPIVAYQPAGKGRVMAIGVDSTWRWALGGYKEFFERFWRQLISFVANKEALRRGPLWIELPKRLMAPGIEVDFLVYHELPEEEAENLQLLAEVAGLESSVALEAQPAQNVWRGSFSAPQAAGDYWIKVQARRGETIVETAQARFLVEERDIELENPAADWTMLQHLAVATEGEVIRVDDFARLIRQLQEKTQELEATLEVRMPLWDRWPWLVAAILLAVSEWYLRRRWGLV